MEIFNLVLGLMSLIISAWASGYAGKAAQQARKANEIAITAELKPRRLSVYASMKSFLHFCSTYRTIHCVGEVKGTCELVAKMDAFKWEIEQHGPLDMPEVEKLAVEAVSKAWQLQRLYDRQTVLDVKPCDSKYPTAEDNIFAILYWFATREKELGSLFEPYLRIISRKPST
jgi:hypothetical protein